MTTAWPGPRQPGPKVMGNVMRTRAIAKATVVLAAILCVSCWPRHQALWLEPLLVVIDCDQKTTLIIDVDRTVELSSPDERLHSEISREEFEKLNRVLASDAFFEALKANGARTSPYELRCISFSGVIVESSHTHRGLQIEPTDVEHLPAVVHDVLHYSTELRGRLVAERKSPHN